MSIVYLIIIGTICITLAIVCLGVTPEKVNFNYLNPYIMHGW